MIPCQNCTVTAGFWNMHVHFTEPKWSGVEWQRKEKLDNQLSDMLTSRGFTSVVDLASDLRDTVSLRRRIESGEVKGPFIYTAGAAIYPENGVPFYVRETAPRFIQWLLPQPATPEAAVQDVRRDIGAGTDVLKLFTGAYVARGKIKPMRVDIATAAVETAHGHGQIAFAHPSNIEGVKVVLASGVDVLAHTPDTTDGISDEVIARMARQASMIPTLKMFGSTVTKKPAYLQPIYNIVRGFRADGGNLLFGTDVGYMTDYTTEDEFDALAQCGLGWADILRMLTVAPAARMGVANTKGTLTPGKLADFVVLGSDPTANIEAFADVRATVRSGKILWQKGGA
jgi:imidazolonepropionase-like amidohydrolase